MFEQRNIQMFSPEMPAWGPPNGELPEAPEMPAWGAPTWGPPVGELPESPETPSWGPPAGALPESPETPSWGPPPGMLPESPETPPWGPPPGMLPESPETPSWGPPLWGPPSGVNSNYCSIRFLYAAVNQPAVNISIGSRSIVNQFRYSNVTPYYMENSGLRTITVRNSQNPGFILNRTSFAFLPGYAYTVALINTANNGLALYFIVDRTCRHGINQSCVRTINLSFNSPPLSIYSLNGRPIFTDIPFRGISHTRSFIQGAHPLLLTDSTRRTLATSVLNVQDSDLYTMYMIGNRNGFPALELKNLESDLLV